MTTYISAAIAGSYRTSYSIQAATIFGQFIIVSINNISQLNYLDILYRNIYTEKLVTMISQQQKLGYFDTRF
ncbi:hypothetical protein [Fischerella thermalis]|uniref:hypothetical protein n=1 Tax=Fischerella thermalis TaxID=372787 RepID=UPI0011AF310E|nr:hypothetical protein [Fischerella thermalis]MBF1991489.1 hypothetical protein [Fischerella thermalis M58_A2018_009]MBF2059729.1 hypothetical protein [Fischerella thermalis M66_A2018_004]